MARSHYRFCTGVFRRRPVLHPPVFSVRHRLRHPTDTRGPTRREHPAHVYPAICGAAGIWLVHALLIWHGDILTSYALVSFALLLFRDVTPKRQLAWAFVLYLFAGDIITRVRWLAGQRIMVPRVPPVTANWIYGHGSLAQIHHQRVLDVADWFGRWGLTTYFYILSIFLAGVWAFRSGFFQRLVSDRRATRRFLTGASAPRSSFSRRDSRATLSRPAPRPPTPLATSCSRGAVSSSPL